ncbi:MAG TPA: malonyl-ACP O-methyltransferase BioC [Cellvibrio sp.]|nr:malonyl-ACP O-methyltransferase BioC [Cellvibrio sp.]
MSEKSYTLAAHYYPCLQNPSLQQQALSDDIVLLHGWGSGSQSWQPLIAGLQNIANVIALDLPGFGESESIPEFTLEAVVQLIAAQLPEKCVLIGWSLGGMLAVQIAARYPQKISHLITLAANTKFVASRDYETAMPLAVNRQFNKSFAADPQSTLKLFSGLLAQGDTNERALLKQIRALAELDKINPNWLQALELLSQLDNREAFAELTQPGLHVLAEKDVLVPVAAAQALEQLNPHQYVQVIAGAAHALHWSQQEVVVQAIQDFIQPVALDKKQVAHSFSRAAATYDSVANLQRKVGDVLLQKLTPNLEAQVVLDLGCGTGYFTPRLQSKYPQALVVGVDIAEGMLRFAREHHWLKNGLCADAEYLPFADQSVDIIYSNFALQWCANLQHLLAELQRVLKPGGEIIFTTLGPATLRELRSAWEQVDALVHVNQFHEREQLEHHLQVNALQVIEFEHAPEVMQFERLSDLTRSLKALGAQNMNRGRATGLTGRKKIQAFKQAYENFRSNNVLPATYDVFYVKVKTP